MASCVVCSSDVRDDARFCPACGAEQPKIETEGDDPFIGQMVAGNFRIEKLLGVGGMGKVYKARQLSLDKAVVIKILHDHFKDDPQLVQRFQREAKAASRLNHPNSIQVIDFGQDETGVLYMAIEYLDGQDLFAILRESGPMPEARIARIMYQVCSALAEAHDQHVIHRDLKPENIMLEDRRGQADYVKVLDFGIAKIQDPDDTGQALTQAGMVCGTPEYMSPEQARGGALDFRSDLYALGVLTYQLATGELPFHADSPIGIVTKHILEKPVPPRQRKPELNITDRLESIILKAMEKDADARFQSTIAMGDAFEQLMLSPSQAMSVAPGPASAPNVVAPPEASVSNPVPVAAAPEVSAKNVVPAPAPAPAVPPVAPVAQASSSSPLKWVGLALALVALGVGGAFAASKFMKPKVPIASEGEGEVKPKGEGEGEGEVKPKDPPPKVEDPKVVQLRADALGAYKVGNLTRAVELQKQLTVDAPNDIDAKLALQKWEKELAAKSPQVDPKKDPKKDPKPKVDPEVARQKRIKVLRTRVDSYAASKKWSSAIRALKELKKIAPEHKSVFDSKIAEMEEKKSASANASSGKSRRERSNELKTKASTLGPSHIKQRISLLEKAVKIDPSNVGALNLLALAYKINGNAKSACSTAKKMAKHLSSEKAAQTEGRYCH